MKIHTHGCFAIFSEQIRGNIGIVGGVGIGIGLIQVDIYINRQMADR